MPSGCDLFGRRGKDEPFDSAADVLVPAARVRKEAVLGRHPKDIGREGRPRRGGGNSDRALTEPRAKSLNLFDFHRALPPLPWKFKILKLAKLEHPQKMVRQIKEISVGKLNNYSRKYFFNFFLGWRVCGGVCRWKLTAAPNEFECAQNTNTSRTHGVREAFTSGPFTWTVHTHTDTHTAPV